jgi:hypothetical protein
VPVALNGSVTPTERIGSAGVIDMEDSVAAVTVKTALLERTPEVAVMIAAPGETAVTRPLLTVATHGLEELHETCAVIS